MSDSELSEMVRALQAGRPGAFDRFFDRLYPEAVTLATRMLRDRDRARDAAQDVFIALWQKRDRLEPGGSIRSYVLRSVHNRCLNILRDEKPAEPMREDHLEIPDTPVPAGQREALLRSLIAKLPDRQREALTLSRFEGQSHEQIAAIMQISARTVNNHIVQALHGLRRFSHLLREL